MKQVKNCLCWRLNINYCPAEEQQMNTFTTEHLLLRNWQKSDLQDLHNILCKEAVALPAGLQPMRTPEETKQSVLEPWMKEPTRFAICLRADSKLIGYIGLRSPDMDSYSFLPEELEVGTFIDVTFWGKGYVPEAVRCLEKYAFEELNCTAIWAAYFKGNEQSHRCFEKCGFKFHHTEEDRYMIKLNDTRTELFTRISKEEWWKETH